jgi:UDP-3-O-[3-hydroxymyristoyl] glucosamine N-acyltransferase
MQFSAAQIALIINGKVEGDANKTVTSFGKIEEASAEQLSFLANPKYAEWLNATSASAILVSPGTEALGKNLIVVNDPYGCLGKLLTLFYPKEENSNIGVSDQAWIDDQAVVSEKATVFHRVTVTRGAKIAPGVVLYPGVYIGEDVVIGEDTLVYPNVTVYSRSVIGKRVILHAGVVVGSDGFGFANPGSSNDKIPQVGYVQIDDDVEIGANTTIDRGTLGRTWIQKGAKIDNLVQIAHNVVVGEYSVIAALSGISGSTKLGKGVILAGQAGLVGHINLGDHVVVSAQSGVHDDVPAGEVVSGSPHLPHRDWLRVVALTSRLPDMKKDVRLMQKKVEELENKVKGF